MQIDNSHFTRTTADGDSRSRVPSCGRRYADAPTAVLITARGGGEFPPSSARQASLLRTRTGLRFIRRFSLCANVRRRGNLLTRVCIQRLVRDSKIPRGSVRGSSPSDAPLTPGQAIAKYSLAQRCPDQKRYDRQTFFPQSRAEAAVTE